MPARRRVERLLGKDTPLMTAVLDVSPVHDTPAARTVVRGTDLSRRYGSGDTAVDALRSVSLEIPRGHLTAVMGPSGSGKSTLMHILAGLDRPTEGSVEIDGIEITSLGDNDLTKLRRRHIGFVFQFFNLLPMLTAEENVAPPALDRRREARPRLGRGAARGDRPRRPAHTSARRTLGRPAAAGRGRARSPVAADRALRRRADGQPRLAHERARSSRSSVTPSPSTARRP